jgi:hypothetical protein
MDPISALGLAGNIVQFLDFGCKLFSKAKDIHRNGSIVEHTDMLAVTDDLRRYTRKLHKGLRPTGTLQLALSEDDTAFLDICDGCLKVAEELEQAVKALQLPGRPSKWKSFRQALKSVWGKERLVEIKSRLDLYGDQLDRRMIVSFGYVHLLLTPLKA